MSFGKSSSLLTWILIALIPVGAGAGILIGWAVFSGGETYTIDVQGSTTVEKIATLSAVPFMNTHPGVTVTVAGTGSGTGIGTLINQQCDVAMASRPVKSSENDTAFANTGEYLRAYAIAKDGLAIVINDAATGTLDLAIDEIKSIFNGTVTSWTDPLVSAAGLTGDIQVVVREEGSGTRDAFNELIMGDDAQDDPDEQYVGDALPMTSNQQIFDEVESNEQAIGYVGLGYVQAGVEAVDVDGVTPSFETVVGGTYPVQRDLFLVTLGTPAVDGLIWEYVSWHFGPEGQYWVFDAGYINVLPRRED
jgi:phosphate transport system substrate-binding protein